MNVFQKIEKALKTVSDTPDLDARLLLSSASGKAESYWLAHPDAQLTVSQCRALDEMVARRQQGEPIAYILGDQPFWSLTFNVTPDVLIPRPETECLIEWVLSHYSEKSVLRVADLGTGSGCIAVSLAHERKHWSIDAVDVSRAALSVAKQNAEKNQCSQVRFYEGSWCRTLPQKEYDLIISNPPYIAAGDSHLFALRYEPTQALVSGETGLRDIETIVEQARSYLKPGGALALEHGFDQREAVLASLQKAGYADAACHLDLSQQPRFSVARWYG